MDKDKLKHSLWSLCGEFDKVEIPMLQRDFAFGRQQPKVNEKREAFARYLAANLLQGRPIELDFVYGGNDLRSGVFTPLDGQQRLTILWLLHWLVALRLGRIADIRQRLGRFGYEVRPSSKKFCGCLLSETFGPDFAIDSITDQWWFDAAWQKDPSVAGMIEMLKTLDAHIPAQSIQKFAHLQAGERDLLDALMSERKPIAFYFAPIEDFGLSDTLYVRMNARGKQLTDFEKFKSEFYTLLGDYAHVDDFKDRMEYGWVTILWPYRPKGVYVTDAPFLHLLEFVTLMLYHGSRKRTNQADNTPYADVMEAVYSDHANIDFLAFVLNAVPYMERLFADNTLLWGDPNAPSMIRRLIVDGIGKSVPETMVMYGAMRYLYNHHRAKDEDGGAGIDIIAPATDGPLFDFLRVVRNLIVNTADNTNREWPNIIPSIDRLAAHSDVYATLASGVVLTGFYNPQVEEENYKARQIVSETDPAQPLKGILHRIEDEGLLRGNIRGLLIIESVAGAKQFREARLDSSIPCPSAASLQGLYQAYGEVTKNEASEIWGTLLDSALYNNDAYRVTYDGTWPKNYAIIREALRLQRSGLSLTDYINVKMDSWLRETMKATAGDPWSIRNPKKQLQLYYILTMMYLGRKDPEDFFAHRYNFGWLPREKGYMSLYVNGIEKSSEYPEGSNRANPIFQRYGSQFRYNCGINPANTLELEKVDHRTPSHIDNWLAQFAPQAPAN